jgi:hypothetical protein
MRRSRFLAAAESEVDPLPFIRKRLTELPHCQISHKPAVALSPGFNNEKKVEHLAIINEASIVQSFFYANSNKVLTALYQIIRTLQKILFFIKSRTGTPDVVDRISYCTDILRGWEI